MTKVICNSRLASCPNPCPHRTPHDKREICDMGWCSFIRMRVGCEPVRTRTKDKGGK